jgi:putative ABC transport system permease protein
MRTPLPWLNLVHQRRRTLVAVAGVAFALLLIFMQLGFLGSAVNTATLLYDELDFDVALLSSQYRTVNAPGTFPRERLYQALSVPGVRQAVPLHISFNRWRSTDAPDEADRLPRRRIMVLGYNLAEPVFKGGAPPQLEGHLADLRRPDTVLMDRRSRKDFGPQYLGRRAEIGVHQVTVVGRYTIGGGFGSEAVVVTSEETFCRLFGGMPLDRVSIGLIRLSPGADPEAVADALEQALPADVQAKTRAKLAADEQHFWVLKTAVGVIFLLGVGVAFVVGVVFTYQVISSDITNHLAEYATLKAMGYGRRYLAGVVLVQANILALLGYVPGLLASLALYAATRAAAGIPIFMEPRRAVLVLVVAVAMCSLSGLFSVKIVTKADPADLF